MAVDSKKILTLPTLALRGVSVYPGTVLNFDVERPMSIAALNAAIGTDRLIFLVAQRDMAQDTPTMDGLYAVGTVCRLGQILRTSGSGGVKAIVEGLYRARLLRVTAEAPCFWANVQAIPEAEWDPDDLRRTALIRYCNKLFAEYAGITGSVGPEVLVKTGGPDDPGFVADHIAHNVFLPPADKQTLLEEANPPGTPARLAEMLGREIQVLGIEQNLQETAAEHMAKNQKDYYLREQLKIIQEELGEGAADDDLESYRQRILELGLEEDVEKKLLKELSRLAKQPFGSAEGAVLRTYLDVCLELPWNQRTEEIRGPGPGPGGCSMRTTMGWIR